MQRVDKRFRVVPCHSGRHEQHCSGTAIRPFPPKRRWVFDPLQSDDIAQSRRSLNAWKLTLHVPVQRPLRCTWKLNSRLLLRSAVDATTSGSDAVNVELHNRALGKESLQGIPRRGICLGVAELRCNHRAVANIEVDVSSREVVARELGADVSGSGKCDDLEMSSVSVRGVFEYFQMRERDGVVEGLGISVERGHDHTRPHEPRIEVGVAIGDVLTGDARKPDDLAQAEMLLQFRLDLRARAPGVAVGVDKTALSDDRRPVPVDLDTTAFADNIGLDVCRAAAVGKERCNKGVLIVLLLLASTVEVEIHRADISFAAQHKARTSVANPQIIHRSLDKFDTLVAELLREGAVSGPYKHRDRLEPHDRVGDPGKILAYAWNQLSSPDLFTGTKSHPRTIVRLALVRHEPIAHYMHLALAPISVPKRLAATRQKAACQRGR